MLIIIDNLNYIYIINQSLDLSIDYLIVVQLG